MSKVQVKPPEASKAKPKTGKGNILFLTTDNLRNLSRDLNHAPVCYFTRPPIRVRVGGWGGPDASGMDKVLTGAVTTPLLMGAKPSVALVAVKGEGDRGNRG